MTTGMQIVVAMRQIHITHSNQPTDQGVSQGEEVGVGVLRKSRQQAWQNGSKT